MKSFVTYLLACAALSGTSVSAQSPSLPSTTPPVAITGAAVTVIPQAGSSAVTVVSGQEVQVGEITSVRDLTGQVPDLSVFDGANQRAPLISVRGFRENDFGAGNPVVGLYVDDVPYFDLYSRGMPLFDVREIEFARGDQSALYGASGVGGVINVRTAQPQNQTHGYAGASYGDYNAQNYQLGLAGPLVTNLLYFGINGLDSSRIGFVYNNVNHDNPDSQDSLDLRGVLRWTPSQPWDITLTAHAGSDRDGFVPTYAPGVDSSPFNVSRDPNGFVNTSTVDEALKISYDNESVRVTSILSHRDWRQNLEQDFFSPALDQGVGDANPKLEQWTEEFRVESPDPASALRWRTGLYYAQGDFQNDSGAAVLPFLNPALSDSTSETYALFGQATYALWEKLDVTAGLRLTYDYRNLQQADYFSGVPLPAATIANVSDEFTAAQPKFGLACHFTPELELYATATEGYESGGFNPADLNPSLMKFSPERDWQFELGAKSSWWNNKLSANAALFYTIANDYQSAVDNGNDPQQAYALNAHRADLYGAEVELTARPIKALDVSAGLSYTDARYDRFTEPAAAGGLALDGERISLVPEFTGNVSARYRLPWWHVYLHGEAIVVGRYFLTDTDDAGGQVAQDTYFVVNAQLGYQVRNFDVYVFAKNILDAHYYNGAGPAPMLQPGDPTTYGVAATARF